MSFLSALADRRAPTGAPLERAMGGGVDLLGLLFKGGRGAGTMTPAGVFVDQAKAEGVLAFWRGANIIATAGGALPLNVYEKGENRRETIVENPRESVVWQKANPEVPNSIFWMDAFLRAAVTGDSFSRVVTVADPHALPRKRRPIELWPIETHRVQVGRASDGRKVYVIDGQFDDPKMDFSAGGTILHVPGPSTNGLRGESPVLKFARSLGLAIAEEIYQSSLLGNGSQIGGYLSSDQPITLAQAEEAAKIWDDRHKGVENAGRTPVMGRGVKWLTTQLNAVDAALFQAIEFSSVQMGQLHGVPLWMLGVHSKDSSWGSGLEEQFKTFLVITLNGWLKRFQDTISDELLPQKNHVAKFDTTTLTAGKLVDQVNAAKSLVQAGYDPAESLQVVGLPPITHTGMIPVGGGAGSDPPPEPPRAAPIDLTVNVDLPALAITNEAALPPPARTVTKHIIRDEHGAIAAVREEEG